MRKIPQSELLQPHEFLRTAVFNITNAFDRLEKLKISLFERTTVIDDDSATLNKIINQFDVGYNLLAEKYSVIDQIDENYDDALDLFELIISRLKAVSEFIRPYRVKHSSIDVSLIIHFLEHEHTTLKLLVKNLQMITNNEDSTALLETLKTFTYPGRTV